MRRALCTALGAIALIAMVPGVAGAATPFTAGSGTKPDVAVGFDGAAHVVWTTATANDQVGYCKVGQFSESCDRTELLGFPTAISAAARRATVAVPSAGKVVIVAGCASCPGSPNSSAEKAFRWISTDNGATFGAATQIGTGYALNGVGTWIEGPNMFVGANSNSVMAQTAPTSVGTSIPVAPAGYFYDGEVVRLPGAEKLVGASNDLNTIGYRVHNGPLTPGAINDAGFWDGQLSIPAEGGTNGESSLNAGGGGVSMVHRSQVGGATRLALRHFDATAEVFGSPVFIQGDNPLDVGLQHPDSYQDLAGRLDVVWRVSGSGGQLRYRSGQAIGTGFGPVGTLATGENFTDPEIGVGNEAGYVTWTQGVTGSVRVVRVDPVYDPPAGTPPPAVDPAEPVVTKPAIGKRTLRPGEGTTFRFTSNVAGQAVLTIEKRYAGLKGKRKGKNACLPRTKKRLRALRRKAASPAVYRKQLKKKSCRAYRRVGEIRQPVKAGVNTIVFSGRVAGRKLGRGAYRATLVVTNALGEASRTETLTFKVVEKKRKPRKRARR